MSPSNSSQSTYGHSNDLEYFIVLSSKFFKNLRILISCRNLQQLYLNSIQKLWSKEGRNENLLEVDKISGIRFKFTAESKWNQLTSNYYVSTKDTSQNHRKFNSSKFLYKSHPKKLNSNKSDNSNKEPIKPVIFYGEKPFFHKLSFHCPEG